jgi:pimeloyl-ACP methyl ester carboxylesterase
MPCYADALRAIPIPITLMVGGRDAKFLAIAKGLSEPCAHIHLVTVEGAGHNLLLEASAEVGEQLRRMESRVRGDLAP